MRPMGIKKLNFKFALIWFDGSEFIISNFNAQKFSFRAGFWNQMSQSELGLEVLSLSVTESFLCRHQLNILASLAFLCGENYAAVFHGLFHFPLTWNTRDCAGEERALFNDAEHLSPTTLPWRRRLTPRWHQSCDAKTTRHNGWTDKVVNQDRAGIS